jgi:replicative DNA helicase
MKREYGIKLLVLDYLQLMDGAQEGDNREQEISKISRGLKKLAKELEIPIIALSQLSRQVESRPSKKPQLSDLRDSGAIEQDADMVIFLLRPEYYNQNTYLYGNEEMNTDGLMLHIIAKFRGGQVGELRNRWIAETTSIADWDRPASNDLIKKIENNYNFLND